MLIIIEEYDCNKEYLLYILYSNCSDEDGSCSPYTNTEEAQTEDEEGIERETAEENDLEDDTRYIMFKENISLTKRTWGSLRGIPRRLDFCAVRRLQDKATS